MLYKYLGYELFNKVGVDVQPHQLSVDLITPRTIASLMLGMSLYTRYVQPEVRKEISMQKKDTTVLVKLLLKSRQIQKPIMKTLIILGALSSLNSYYVTKQKHWIWGVISFSSGLLFDFLFLQKLQKKLKQIMNKNQRQNKKTLEQNEIVIVKQWSSRNSISLAISIITVCVLYFAELKVSEGYDVKLKLNQ